jgi:hypothetical protein
VGEREQLGDTVVVEAEDLENLLLIEADTAFEDLFPCGRERVCHRLRTSPFASYGHGASMFVVIGSGPVCRTKLTERRDVCHARE